MPATITHHVFAEDVYNNLDELIKDKIDIDKFKIFNKSFDILFFTNSDIGFVAHNNKVNLFFVNIIKFIKDNNLYRDKDVLTYLYGAVCHYVLDSTIHPFVYYKSGRYNANDKSTYKYRGMHAYVESMMDAALYELKYKKSIRNFNLAKEIFPDKLTMNDNLINTINYTFKETYNVDNVANLYNSGYRNYKFLFKHGMVSSFGIKSFIYKILDCFKFYKKGRLRNLCYYIRKIDNNVLNLERKNWCFPANKDINYHYSFYDLYDIGIEKAKSLIIKIDKQLENDDVSSLLEEIGNISYYTGLDESKKYKMKYFEY